MGEMVRRQSASAGQPMDYLAELYYLQDQAAFPYRKAVLITATTVGRWSRYYYAELIAPTSVHTDPKRKTGPLPVNPQANELFVTQLLTWLFEDSASRELFRLRMSAEPVAEAGGEAQFDHHDNPASWVLRLTASQFAQLQAAWEAHRLPTDLFYPEGQTICIPYPGEGVKARLLRLLRVQKCYTPKRWEARNM